MLCLLLGALDDEKGLATLKFVFYFFGAIGGRCVFYELLDTLLRFPIEWLELLFFS